MVPPLGGKCGARLGRFMNSGPGGGGAPGFVVARPECEPVSEESLVAFGFELGLHLAGDTDARMVRGERPTLPCPPSRR